MILLDSISFFMYQTHTLGNMIKKKVSLRTSGAHTDLGHIGPVRNDAFYTHNHGGNAVMSILFKAQSMSVTTILKERRVKLAT